MQTNNLSASDFARELGVAQATVTAWTAETGVGGQPMPESELRLLQYALMTENTRVHLF